MRVEDAISLESLDSEESVEFLLNSALEIIDSNPAVERVPLGEVEGFYGINGTSIELSGEIELARYRLTENPDDGLLAMTYAGEFDFGLSEQKEEYTRGFRETAGIISEEGVYLAGSGFWYPSFGDQLLSFEMDVKMPEDWHVISQGNGTAGGGEGKAHWSSGGSMDEIYLVGGPLEAYEEAAGNLEHIPVAEGTATITTFTTYQLEGHIFWNLEAGRLDSLELSTDMTVESLTEKDPGQDGGDFSTNVTLIGTWECRISVRDA